MGIVGNRIVDLFLGVIGSPAAPLAPWKDEQSRAIFWGIATLLDSAADAARQSVRLWMGADKWPADAIAYVSRNRGLLVPRKTAFDWRGWIGSHWTQHARSGTKAGIVAGCNASHPQEIIRVDADEDGWYLILPESVGVPQWDDGTDWDEGPAWDVNVSNLDTLYHAARYWGPAKLFRGAKPDGGE